MKTLLLNLPHPTRIMRRYVASYHAVNFLMPPLELLSLGGVLRDWKGAPGELLDAIGEGLDAEATLSRVREARPGLVVSLVGFRSFGEDVGFLSRVKEALPEGLVVAFGYLAGLYARELLEREAIDAVIAGEPEQAFSDLHDRYSNGDPLEGIPGVTWREGDAVHENAAPDRIRDLDHLPFPDHSLARRELYNESFLGRPLATTISARGCPFQCTFCVRMYGNEVVFRSAGNVLDELEAIRTEHGIRNLRFMDDTFTLDRKRVLEICAGIRKYELGLRWTCLTRIDSVDPEMLDAMRESGCLRLYVGIESGSQRVLDAMEKRLTVETIREKMKAVRSSGMESSAFLISGFPGETPEDHEATVRLMNEVGLDYIIATKAQCWPGTQFFEQSGRAPFDPWDPHSEGDPDADAVSFERERELYRRFYLRPGYVLKSAARLLKNPSDLLQAARQLLAYLRKPRGGDDDFI